MLQKSLTLSRVELFLLEIMNVYAKVKLLRNHGIKSEEEVLLAGTNAKMNEFQAAMGLCNLEDIEAKIEKRKEIYEKYKEDLGEIENINFQKSNCV